MVEQATSSQKSSTLTLFISDSTMGEILGKSGVDFDFLTLTLSRSALISKSLAILGLLGQEDLTGRKTEKAILLGKKPGF